MPKRSYRRKVALWAIGYGLTVIIALQVSLMLSVHFEFNEMIDNDMESVAAAVLSSFRKPQVDQDPLRFSRNFEAGSYRSLFDEADQEEEALVSVLATQSPEGEFLFEHPLLWNPKYPELIGDDGRYVVEANKWEIRRYVKSGWTVYLGLNGMERMEEYLEIGRSFALALPMVLVAIAVGAWLLGWYTIRPVESISKAVSRIQSESLSERVPGSDRSDEFGDLAVFINRMLVRLEHGYLQAKRFTADASHELRTPLAVLQAELENRIQTIDNPSDVDAHGRMLGEVRRLKALTHSLLFLARADSGTLEMAKERCDLVELTRQLCEDLEGLGKDREVAVEFDTCLSEADVVGDRILLEQAISNLLSNALKYNRNGGSVAIRLDRKDDFFRIRVANAGDGIPQAVQDRLFERFFRSQQDRSRATGGFGLGLNIARLIARNHGGEIDFVLSNGELTVFEMRLPLVGGETSPL